MNLKQFLSQKWISDDANVVIGSKTKTKKQWLDSPADVLSKEVTSSGNYVVNLTNYIRVEVSR